MKSVLRCFELVSRFKINYHKSSFMGVNVEESFLYLTTEFLNCKVGSIPFKYLVPVGANPRRASTWQPLIEALTKRLLSWKNRYLSLGRRIILLN